MNETSQLDRLVDGELTDLDRRELLANLDSEPDGWRRCALAFLESQTWQRSLQSVVAEPHEATTSPAPITTRERSTQHNWQLAALAASIAVAFTLGFAGGDRWRFAHSGSDDVDSRVVAIDQSVAENSDAPDNSPTAQRVDAQTVAWDGPHMRVGFLAVENDADGTVSHMPVNVVAGPGVDESWLDQVPPAISARYVEILRRRGYEVQQEREIVPFDVAGGQRVMLPVDHVRIIPVSDVVY